MFSKPFTVPLLARQIMSAMPVFPGSVLFVTMANFVLKDQLPNDFQEEVKGKHFRINVIDSGIHFSFVHTGEAFAPEMDVTTPDLIISANTYDFLQLALRKEDPDTLFFSRRLVMEGDTELGVLLKNTLDATDWDVKELISLKPVTDFLALFKALLRQ